MTDIHGNTRVVGPVRSGGRVVRVKTTVQISRNRSEAQIVHVENIPPAHPHPIIVPGGALERDDLSSLLDGSQTVFATEFAFVGGTTQLYLNGLLQAEPDDYIEREDLQSVQLEVAPAAGEHLIILYNKGG